MGWMTAAEAARKWGVTPPARCRSLCAEGRVAGAERFGPRVAHPRGCAQAGRPAPAQAHRTRLPPRAPAGETDVKTDDAADAGAGVPPFPLDGLMPLMATPFVPGSAAEAAASFPEGRSPRHRPGPSLPTSAVAPRTPRRPREPYFCHEDLGRAPVGLSDLRLR